MTITPLRIPEVLLISPKVFGDDRGFFFESFNRRNFESAIGMKISFVQDNHSKSHKGVLRGLHYQIPPMEQGKLLRVAQGEIFDVAVDIRPNSPTFGQWVGETLSSENRKQLWIPEGFAHGFLTVSNTADVLYKTTNYYSPEHEGHIRYDSQKLLIDWPMNDLSISASKKDLQESDLSIFSDNNA